MNLTMLSVVHSFPWQGGQLLFHQTCLQPPCFVKEKFNRTCDGNGKADILWLLHFLLSPFPPCSHHRNTLVGNSVYRVTNNVCFGLIMPLPYLSHSTTTVTVNCVKSNSVANYNSCPNSVISKIVRLVIWWTRMGGSKVELAEKFQCWETVLFTQ